MAFQAADVSILLLLIVEVACEMLHAPMGNTVQDFL
jgi:hypothetical protein